MAKTVSGGAIDENPNGNEVGKDDFALFLV